jgi:hypothetical protein
MVAGLALATGQPVGHLLDLLGTDRRWPAVFDAIHRMQVERSQAVEAAESQRRREAALKAAKERYR